MTVKMKALQSFSGPDGKHAQGDVFEVAAKRAEFLAEGGYAARTDAGGEPAAPVAEEDLASAAAAPRASKTAKASKA